MMNVFLDQFKNISTSSTGVDTSAGTRPMNLWSGQLKFISYIHRIGKISQSSLLNVTVI